ncbi:MAG TPA: membrane protein insertion efficiency factor YidD [Patescibacteria group bacterium]
MKTLLILTITVYQKLISPLAHQLLGVQAACRYEKSCSTFAKEAITQQGILKGSRMALTRLASCQPFGKTYANL